MRLLVRGHRESRAVGAGFANLEGMVDDLASVLRAYPAGKAALLGITLAAAGCRMALPGQVELLASRELVRTVREGQKAIRLESNFGGVVSDPAIQARLDRIGRRLVAGAPECRGRCYFRLLGSVRPNALSLPQGGVYVTRGLYERLKSDGLVAAALAHELAHVARGDGWRPSKTLEDQLQKEIRADHRAVEYLATAGFDPRCVPELLEIVSSAMRPGWAETRIRAAEREIDLLVAASRPAPE